MPLRGVPAYPRMRRPTGVSFACADRVGRRNLARRRTGGTRLLRCARKDNPCEVGMERIEMGGISVEALIAGAGPSLLFLHGGDYVAQNRPLVDRLAQRFRVVAPRHPGFGTTPRPAWFRSVGDIAYLYLDPLYRPDLHQATLVGSSFGGWVALEIAVRSTARITRLALIDSLGLKFGGREER